MPDKETQTETEDLATFKLTLDGNGISVERSVDSPTAWRIMAVLMEAEGAAAGSSMPAMSAPHTGQPALGAQGPATSAQSRSPGPGTQSLREFLDAHEPGRNVETIVAIATYLKVHRGMETFKREDVKKGFREASEPVPGNYGRDFNWARSAAWIANTDTRGEYYVTDTGLKAVRANFPPEVRKASAVGKTARKRRSKAKTENAD
jgi:hypothetical protein